MEKESKSNIIAEEIFNTLDYMYCYNCRNNDKNNRGYEEDGCDDCHRKYNGWGVSYSTCEQIANKIVSRFDKEIKWTEFKICEMTEEEKEAFPNCCFMLDCEIPEDGQDILVSDGMNVWADVFYYGGSDGCGLEGRGDIEDGMAWMPMPKPFKRGELNEIN